MIPRLGRLAPLLLALLPASAPANPLLPPKWAFGVLYGSYHDQDTVLKDAARLRKEGYGGDLYWVDSSWLYGEYDHGAEHYIDFKFDPKQFPDPGAMIRMLRQDHFHFGVWEWPFIDKSNPLYAYGESHHLFVADAAGHVVKAGGWHGVKFTGQFDFTNPAAVAWWDELHQPLVDLGFEFYKLDTGGGYRQPGVLFDGVNQQNHLRQAYHKASYDLSARGAGAQGRGFILTHEAPATANDQTPGIWTGDTPSSWAGFRDKDVGKAAQLNTPETAAYWCGDTGGYDLVKQPDGTRADSTDELYIRWLEYSSFTPMQEFFSSKPAKGRFPWNFGAEAQKIFRQYTGLRYRLLPFRYSEAQAAYHETPCSYPVRFIGRSQIVLGHGASQLLVQPVTEPGVTTAQVPLPAGSDWIDYWTGRRFGGGSTASVEAPLDREPVFVRAGAIIPMGPPIHFVDEAPANPLTLDVYPSGATSYTYYEDDGVSTEYQRGRFATTVFSSDDAGGRETVSVEPTRGDFAGRLAARTYYFKIHLAAAPRKVTRDAADLAYFPNREQLETAMEGGWCYDPAEKAAWIKIKLSASESARIRL